MRNRNLCIAVSLVLSGYGQAVPAQDVPTVPGDPETSIYGSPYATASDQEILKNVRLALRLEPYAEREGIQIQVNEGVVTLSGEVESAVERYDAEQAAREVRGVVAVKNELTVRR